MLSAACLRSFFANSVFSAEDLSSRVALGNNGTIGYRIPSTLQVVSLPRGPGDVMLLCSDGLQKVPSEKIHRSGSVGVEKIAASLVAKFGSARDDATAVVAGTTR